jgi:phosphoserine phosphatase RsbX
MAAMKQLGRIELEGCGYALVWAVLGVAKCDDQPSGDGYTILSMDTGLLFAVVDGAGSGTAAADVAEHCLSGLDGSKGQIDRDFRLCHERLKGGRGAALALIVLDAETGSLTWASVGDVDGLLWRRSGNQRSLQASITQTGGTLGITFDGISPQSHPLQPGDLITITTDGVLRDYVSGLDPNQTAEIVAQQILQSFRRPNDDCLVMTLEVTALR